MSETNNKMLFVSERATIQKALLMEYTYTPPELTGEEKDAINEFLLAKGLPLDVNITFGNVKDLDTVLPERYSTIRSRSDVQDFRTSLTPGLEIALPLVSANMESVTGTTMITEIEKLGGIGIPPQTLPPEQLLKILEEVAQEDCAFRDNCLTVRPEQTISQVRELARKNSIYGFIVVDASHRPVGMLSARDWKNEEDGAKLVKDVMGGGRLRPLIKNFKGISFKDAAKLLKEHHIEKLPLTDEQGVLAGAIFGNGLFYTRDHPRATRNARGQFVRVGSIGVGSHFDQKHLLFVEEQLKRGIQALLIDTARGYSVNMQEALQEIKKHFPGLPLIAGNVCTPEAAKALIAWGADCVKIGVGPGEACRTREVGVGIPQLSAGAKCSVIAHRYGKTMMLDGGMKSPGDVAKGLAAGADSVMIGFFFAGTHESAALAFYNDDGELEKDFEGSASFHAQQKRFLRGDQDRIRRPEGMRRSVLVEDRLATKINDLLDGLRSNFSYLGVRSLKEFREVATFQLQTREGKFEGIKHQ